MIDSVSEKREAEALIKDIFEFKAQKCPELNFLDTILEYAYKKDYDIHYVGGLISEHKEFVEILQRHLEEQKYIKSTQPRINEKDW